MIFLLVPAILTITSALQEDSIYRNSIINGKRCHPKPVSELVPLCSKIGYNYTSFPNRRGLNEAATNEELADLKPLIGTNCSNAIVHLLCSIYAPPCMPAYPDWNYPPCKSLCDYVENGCAAVFKQISGYDWPPNPDLNCSQYTTYKKNSLTFCPPDPNKIQMPQPNVAKRKFSRINLYVCLYNKLAIILFLYSCHGSTQEFYCCCDITVYCGVFLDTTR